MGYEVDFLAVGEESQSGDAIALRYGDLKASDSRPSIIVIDGGFKQSGESLADLICRHYDNPKYIDLVVSTHPHADHISGLETILDQFEVGELLMHLPWEHNEGIADKFEDGRVTDESIGKRLKESLEAAWDLYQKACSKGVCVTEPFWGVRRALGSGVVEVLGPSRAYYEKLLLDFGGMPERKATAGFVAPVTKALGETMAWVKELWNKDSIGDDAITSAENNSSVILQITVDDRRLLFTGDAGIPALTQAAGRIDATSAALKLMQIPHHGSHRNVGPTILNRLIGGIIPAGSSDSDIRAVASCAKNGEPKHPSKRVLNAFTRRGVSCYKTQGESFCSCHNAPDRRGYEPVSPCDFYTEVEEKD